MLLILFISLLGVIVIFFAGDLFRSAEIILKSAGGEGPQNPVGYIWAVGLLLFAFCAYYLACWAPVRSPLVQAVNYTAEAYLMIQILILFLVARDYKNQVRKIVWFSEAYQADALKSRIWPVMSWFYGVMSCMAFFYITYQMIRLGIELNFANSSLTFIIMALIAALCITTCGFFYYSGHLFNMNRWRIAMGGEGPLEGYILFDRVDYLALKQDYFPLVYLPKQLITSLSMVPEKSADPGAFDEA